MEDIRRQWPLLAVVFISMVEISESLLFFRRISLSKGGEIARMMTATVLLYQVYSVISRFQRVSATINRSIRATRWALRLFCLEYFLKTIAILSFIVMTNMNPDFDKENIEKSKAQLAKLSVLSKLMFYTPILVGWGLKRTLDELRKEEREALERQQPQQQQQQQQPSPANLEGANAAAMAEEERRQLLRVRSWPRYIVGYSSIAVLFSNLHYFATFPSDSSKWYTLFAMISTLTSSFTFLANYRMSLPGSRAILSIMVGEVIFNVLESAWHTFYKTEDAPHSVEDFIFSTLVDLGVLWIIKQMVQDLEERDARVEAYNARIVAAIAEKARLEATYEESSRNVAITRH